jgi:hypothetical protein
MAACSIIIRGYAINHQLQYMLAFQISVMISANAHWPLRSLVASKLTHTKHFKNAQPRRFNDDPR